MCSQHHLVLNCIVVVRLFSLLSDDVVHYVAVDIGEAEITGLETDLTWMPAAGWRLAAAFAWNDAELAEDFSTTLALLANGYTGAFAIDAVSASGWEVALRAGTSAPSSRPSPLSPPPRKSLRRLGLSLGLFVRER